jgi:hypothetical protein
VLFARKPAVEMFVVEEPDMQVVAEAVPPEVAGLVVLQQQLESACRTMDKTLLLRGVHFRNLYKIS